jgi:hypothetical protein
MSKPNGNHIRTCRYCGRVYIRCNYMIRRGAGTGPDGRWLGDTHEIACARKLAAAGNPSSPAPVETQQIDPHSFRRGRKKSKKTGRKV